MTSIVTKRDSTKLIGNCRSELQQANGRVESVERWGKLICQELEQVTELCAMKHGQ